MKIRSSFILLNLAFIYGCSNSLDESFSNHTHYIEENNSSIRSYTEALAIAQESISILEDHNNSTRTLKPQRTIDSRNGIVVSRPSQTLTRQGGSSTDTLLYIFNFDEDKGFAVVSASKNTVGLLAVTESGHYDGQTSSDNEGFNLFMSLAEKYVEEATPKRLDLNPFIQVKDSTHITEYYLGPYVSVKWGQEDPYGRFCTNGYSGCSITAMAQIMTYYEYPSSINLTYNGADLSTQNLDWTEIKKHDGYTSEYYCEASAETHDAIGRLCKQLVTLTNSNDLDPDGTSTSQTNVRNTFLSLGYQTGVWESYTDAAASLYSDIYNNHLIIMAGITTDESIQHTWILDGIYTYVYEHFSWTKTIEQLDWVLDYHTTETYHYYHYNWGADGLNNGYFLGNVFNTANVYNPDTIQSYRSYTFTNVEVLTVYHQ